MWIKIKEDLINLDTVGFIGLSRKKQENSNAPIAADLYFLQGESATKTIHVQFDTEAEAIDAMKAIEACLDVTLRFP